MSSWNTKTLTLMSLLTAVEIVLSRFLSISAWNTKIGFAFIPVVIAAVLLGPVQAGIVAALADFLGAILFPIGTYFPGFTVTAFFMGLVYGLFLHKRQTILRIVMAVAVHQMLLSLLLNTLWISVLYGTQYWPLLLTRLPQCMILTAVQLIVIPLILKGLPYLRKAGM